MRNIAMLGNTTAGMAAVLFLQHVDKKEVELMEKIVEVYKEVDDAMVAKMEYIVKAD
jgi:hypothetical protein